MFNSWPVLSRIPVHLVMWSLAFSQHYFTQQSFKATDCFFTYNVSQLVSSEWGMSHWPWQKSERMLTEMEGYNTQPVDSQPAALQVPTDWDTGNVSSVYKYIWNSLQNKRSKCLEKLLNARGTSNIVKSLQNTAVLLFTRISKSYRNAL